MCGIFGFSGKRKPKHLLLAGLKRLEYRGYDSWGIAYISDDQLKLEKQIGFIPEPGEGLGEAETSEQLLTGIAHTRWATHGGVTQANAHPHSATDGSFVLAQNGIVENYQELKTVLQRGGYDFKSETDTEVIVRLIESELKNLNPGQAFADNLLSAVCQAFAKLAGRNTIIVLAREGNQIIAIKNGSPLVLGKAEQADGSLEYFLGSDYLSFANYSQQISELENLQGIELRNGNVRKFTLAGAEITELKLSYQQVPQEADLKIDLAGFPDFMLKEIFEQPQTILNATSYSEADLTPLLQALREAQTVYTVGCGTAGFSAGQIAYYLRKHARLKAIELKGYELDSYKELFTNKDLILAISQSGETTDTLEAVEFMRAKGGKVASVVNMLGSTLTKISDYPFFSRTGPEICVASTKAFTAQLAWGYLIAQAFAGNYQQAKSEINAVSTKLDAALNDKALLTNIQKVVNYLREREHAFVLGRAQNFYIALEGALKIKEITYKHLEGFAAGELKHGVIALIEPGTPVLTIISEDSAHADMLSATAEIKARGGSTIGISEKANELFDFHLAIPEVGDLAAIINVLPFQLIAYHMGKALGNNVDKPRNLAKSVTVK